MADSFVSRLITELAAKTTAADTDLVPIADSNGNFFKMTWQKMKQLLLGAKDISGVGDGTVTGAISELNTNYSYEFAIASNQRTSFMFDKKNKVIHFVFNANMEGVPNTSTIKTLPITMRPTSDQMFYGMCVSDSGYQGCAIRIGANGNVDVLAATYNEHVKGCCISGMYQVP